MAIDEEFRFGADASEVIRELEKLPSEARKAGRGIARGVGDGADSAAKETSKAAKKVEKDWRGAFEGSGKIFKTFEGQVGGAFSVVEDFTDGLSEMSATIGVAGTAMVGAGLAVAAASFVFYSGASAAIELGAAALEASESLGALANTRLSAEQRQDVRDLTVDMKGLEVATDLLTVQMGIADGIVGDFVATLGGAALAVGDLLDRAEGAERKLQGIVRPLLTVVSLGSSTAILDSVHEGLDDLAESSREVAKESINLQHEKEAEEHLLRMVADAAAANEKHAREMAAAEREAAAAAREAAAAARELEAEMRAQLAAADRLIAISDKAAAAQLGDAGRIINKWQDLRREVLKLPDDYGLAAEAMAEIDRAQAAEIRDLANLRIDETMRANEEILDSVGSSLAELDTVYAEFGEGVAEHFREQFSNIETLATVTADTVSTVFQGQMQLIEIEISRLREQALQQQQDAIDAAKETADASRAQVDADLEAALEREGITEEERERLLEAAEEERAQIDQTLQADLDAAAKLKADEQRAAVAAFESQQKMARSLAIMDAARSALALIPGFAFLGIGAPFAAAAAAAAALDVQLRIINSQSPPEFPMGGSTDHALIGVQPKEVVMTGQAVDRVGRETLDALNDNAPLPGGGGLGGATIQVILGRKVLAQAVMDVRGELASVLLDPRTGQNDMNRR